MSVRSISVLILAVIFGTSAAVAVNRMRGASGPVTTVPVVTAKAEIPRGTLISADMLQIKAWPKDMAPDKALATVEEAVGRATIMHILADDLVLSTKLAESNAGRGLAPQIPDGMRAYTIQTSKVASNVAGFVLPQNRVDVLLTLKGEHRNGLQSGTSTTLLQAVEILAVDQKLDAPAENRTTDMRSVTLLVSPRQAALLDLGQNMGQLTLSLRNPQDKTAGHTEPTTLVDLLRLRRDTGEAIQTMQIHTLRGSDSDMITVQAN